jgi:hypothetical protein
VGLSGDRAVAQWTNAVTTRTGKPYSNRGVTIFRVEDDKIVEIQDHPDTELLPKHPRRRHVPEKFSTVAVNREGRVCAEIETEVYLLSAF